MSKLAVTMLTFLVTFRLTVGYQLGPVPRSSLPSNTARFASTRASEPPRNLYDPTLLTESLQRASDSFEEAGISFISASNGSASGVLPLSKRNTNQHASHQATQISLLGDYVGGAAVASWFPGTPLAGVHEVRGKESISLWLLKYGITYVKPSTDDVTAYATSKAPKEGESTIKAKVAFRDPEGQLVAKGTFQYFLVPFDIAAGHKILGPYILKSSGGLIAGVRAMIGQEDAHIHKHFAGKHGNLMSLKMVQVMPALHDLVLARKISKDQFLSGWSGQILMIGGGLDPLPTIIGNPGRFYVLDLPQMVDAHRTATETFHGEGVSRPSTSLPHYISCDLMETTVVEALQQSSFDFSEPCMIVMEGLSMYFCPSTLRKIMSGIRPLLSSGGALWMDIVSEKVIERDVPDDVCTFMGLLCSMGEPFVFGHDDPVDLALTDWGFPESSTKMWTTSAKEILEFPPPVASEYQFLHIHSK